ncbi:MAG: helix-turn-helix domain-containing protein [Terriglobales bacterium]
MCTIVHTASRAYLQNPSMASEDVCVRFGKRLRKIRLQRKWTQVDLAVHVGLQRSFISRMESGQTEPCLRSLETLAHGFGISISKLMRGI